MTQSEAEAVAALALGGLASDAERMERFLALTGFDPSRIREEARKPGFLAAIVDYVAADEPLLVAIAEEAGIRPERIVEAARHFAPPFDDMS